MKKIILLSFFAITSSLIFAQKNFGGPVTKTEIHKSAEIPELLSTKNEVNNITIIGRVDEVCQAKGCWMTVNTGSEKMTVKFKDYAFFMPKDCAGKQVIFTGNASKKMISVAEQKHLAQDAGKSKKEIAKIKLPKQEYRFEASGVELD